MRLQLDPGQKLTVVFRFPDGEEPRECSEQIEIEFRPDGVVVSANLPDDRERGGSRDLVRIDGEPNRLDPVIYRVSFE